MLLVSIYFIDVLKNWVLSASSFECHDDMIGGLLGDVFLHLLPHAFLGEHGGGGSAEDHHHHHHATTVEVDNKQNVLVGLGIFGGFFFFFFMDKMMRVLNGGGGHSHDHHAHTHDHKKVDDPKPQEGLRQRKDNSKDDITKEKDTKDTTIEKSNANIKLSAHLNLLADFTHNMTDGLAMAASFYASPAVGATTAVAVFFHEIPHEVGDYAILIQSGFSKQRAMMAQFTTAVGAFLGTIIGILIEEASGSGDHNKHHHQHAVVGLLGTKLQWGDLVIPFTAGGFLYIATVGVIPELLEVTGKVSKDKSQALKEFTAMLVGLGLMVAIAWNEV